VEHAPATVVGGIPQLQDLQRIASGLRLAGKVTTHDGGWMAS
jgi:hypothetical protein